LQHTCEIAHKCERKPNIALFETNESINYSLPVFSQLSDIFASQPFLLTIFRKIVFSIRGIKIAAKNLPTQKQKQKKIFSLETITKENYIERTKFNSSFKYFYFRKIKK
jgi:hypothetical protein